MSQANYAIAGFRAMCKADLQGGTLNYANQDFPCTIGTFELQEVLVGGGFTPMLLGDVQLAADDLPAATTFKAGQNITVTPHTGKVRACKVHSYKELGALVSITLRDVNQGA